LRCLVPVGYVVDLFGGGLALQLILLLCHLFLGFMKDGTIPCPVICISLMIHAIQRSILKSTPASPSVYIATSSVVMLSSGIKGPAPVFQLRRCQCHLHRQEQGGQDRVFQF
jgi:hypothetical protein